MGNASAKEEKEVDVFIGDQLGVLRASGARSSAHPKHFKIIIFLKANHKKNGFAVLLCGSQCAGDRRPAISVRFTRPRSLPIVRQITIGAASRSRLHAVRISAYHLLTLPGTLLAFFVCSTKCEIVN